MKSTPLMQRAQARRQSAPALARGVDGRARRRIGKQRGEQAARGGGLGRFGHGALSRRGRGPRMGQNGWSGLKVAKGQFYKQNEPMARANKAQTAIKPIVTWS